MICNSNVPASAETGAKGRDALEVIFHRSSVRHFTEEPVSREQIETLLRAGMAAPSAMNFQPWSFIVVDNRAQLDTMAAMNPHGKMLSRAPLAIVVCGDTKWTLGEETSENPYWQQDCSAVTENILLAVDHLGLGAVWTGCYPRMERSEAIKSFLGIPEGTEPLCVIVIGHPAPNSRGEMPTPKDKWKPEKIHWGRW